VCERALDAPGDSGVVVRVGVCMVDAATGTFHCGAFDDDAHRTTLDGLLSQTRVLELLVPRGAVMSVATRNILVREACVAMSWLMCVPASSRAEHGNTCAASQRRVRVRADSAQ
jgi:DNA mismatch repair ATPase MutS